MKKLKIFSLFFIGILVLAFVGIAIGGDLNKKPTVIDVAYDYPIKPGSDAWKKFSSHDEMLAAIQIPADVLKNISTRALVETCLNYPLSDDMMSYNSLQQGLEAVISRSNCLQEMLRRGDAGTELLKQYGKTNTEVAQDISNIDSKKTNIIHYHEHAYIEMLLAQNSILANMSEADKKTLVKESLNNFRLRQNRPDIYSFSSLQPAISVMKNVVARADGGLQINGKQIEIGDDETDLLNNANQIVLQAENFTSK
jgi:hypothetical protein